MRVENGKKFREDILFKDLDTGDFFTTDGCGKLFIKVDDDPGYNSFEVDENDLYRIDLNTEVTRRSGKIVMED